MPVGDIYNNPANWVRKHFNREEKHHYEHPKVVLNRKRSQEELQLYPSNSSVTSFPGQGVKLLSKMPTAESLMNPSENEHSMDDDDNNDQELYGGSRKSTVETKRWDVFRVIPIEDSNIGNQKCLELTIRILKVIAYIVTFILVLGAGVMAKGTYLFMTSQIRANHTRVICRNDGDRNHQYHAEIPIKERIAWIWCLAFAFIIPEFFTFFRSVRICVFKSYHRPPLVDFLVVLLFETGHAIGICLFTFAVLPELDAVKGAMLTNCVGLFPAILAVLSRHNEEPKRVVKIFIDILAILAQVTGLVVWPLVDRNLTHAWAIPVSISLISLGWWENYVDKRSPLRIIQSLAKVKSNLYNKTRYLTYAIMAIWKIIVFVTALLVFYYLTEDIAMDLIDNFRKSFGENDIPLKLNTAQQNDVTQTDFNSQDKFEESEKSIPYTSISVLVIQASSALIAYVVGKFACRICIQGFSYAFPVNLTIPVTISLLIAACGVRIESPCFLTSFIPKYLYWDCAQGDFFETFLTREHNWVWLLWLLSQTWITLHIWTPKCERLANTEKLFVTPMYNGLLVDQSLGLNRRRDEEGELKADGMDIENNSEDNEANQFYETISMASDSSETPGHPDKSKKSNVLPTDMITRIYACATMWHETSEEMIAMLKSIFRMDEDQCARRNAQKYLHVIDPDFYEFETHVYFDDAFEISDDNEDENVVNRFVKLMIQVMDEAASNVHQTNIKIRPPKKVPTPYGGRLVWTLPGKTKLIAHLKDKSKIRHRKRWSQVMYMYYLLGHKLMELDIHPDRKEVMAENTYLLTLDGDIDFQPQAVALLVDLMKKNRNLGAACGRIHPIGSGPMVWYQKFEYAIGHWLQKATEHMIGCVLCSPGCFSLFRAKGLMDDNVMRRYTTRSDEARHYVQYDQGEDRWLCTLLLQRGYRVEYSAASDAYTHCPEGFGEFYNQRRRWVPSTIANILDLLMDANRTIKVNDNISRPYIWYQGMLMAGTILGPGTIFLMLVGAFVAAFRIDNWTSFGANIVPILIFMFICFVAKPDHQLLLAEILSALYALIMMAVLVGISLQMKEDGIGSPSFIFIIALSGSFFIAACLHPQEFWCIVPGLIYYLSIPSMYLLLIIYSLINLNIVSWGTREVQTKKTKQELLEEKKQEEEMKKKQKAGAIFQFLGIKDPEELEGGFTVHLANLCSFMLCTAPKPKMEQLEIMKMNETLSKLNDKLNRIEEIIEATHPGLPRRKSMSRGSLRSGMAGDNLGPLAEGDENDSDDMSVSESSESRSLEHKIERDDLTNPYWIEDKDLKKGAVEYLPEQEINFWKELLEKYLHPIDSNKEHQARVATELKELRNKAVFAFFMFNALFILIVFLLQLNKDNLYIEWPLGVKTNVTYIEESNEVRVTKEYLHLEPIGLVFVFFFALIITIQFVAMLFHRFGTLSHILASTELNCFRSKEVDPTGDAFIDKHAVQIVRDLQRLKGLNEANQPTLGRRKTVIHELEMSHKQKKQIGTLDVAFRKRFFSISETKPVQDTPILSGIQRMQPETMKALAVRRDTVYNSEPKRRMQTLGAKNSIVSQGNRHRSNGRLSKVFPPSNDILNGIDNKGFHDNDEEVYVTSRSSISGINKVSAWNDNEERSASQL